MAFPGIFPLAHMGASASPFSYQIANSCVFNDGDNDYLSRTLGVPTDRNVWSISFWMKRGALGTQQIIFSDGEGSAATIRLEADDTLRIADAGTLFRSTTQLLRDPTAYYHILFAVNTDEATANDRIKLFINGNQVTEFGTINNPALNANIASFNIAGTAPHLISRTNAGVASNFDGYLADVVFVDGQALAPASFGRLDSVSGTWVPIPYAGTFGNNGFYLNFADEASLGKDVSGNGNDWVENNIVSANQVNDTPTDNYPVLNPVHPARSTLSDGNLVVSTSGGGRETYQSTMLIPQTGKWYCEFTNPDSDALLSGIIGYNDSRSSASAMQSRATFCGYGSQILYIDGVSSQTGLPEAGAPDDGDVIAHAVDMDAEPPTLSIYLNGTKIGNTENLVRRDYVFVMGDNSGGFAVTGASANFGQRAFTHTPPSGFRALSVSTRAAPVILNPGQFFQDFAYAGDASSPREIVASIFSPEIVVGKPTSLNEWSVYDPVRGQGKSFNFDSNAVETVQDVQGYLSAFNSNGFQVTAGSSGDNNVNDAAPNAYMNWLWRRSSVCGVDIASWTGDGLARTISHNLGGVPELILVKNDANTTGWAVYHKDMDPLSPEDYYYLMDTGGARVLDTTFWNGTPPTDSVFSVGTNIATNESGRGFTAYVFRSIPGFSKIGGYEGNNNVNGTFLALDFRPALFWTKNIDSAVSGVWKDKRMTSDLASSLVGHGGNPVSHILSPDATAAIAASNAMDFLANGAKMRSTGTGSNGASTYAFAAFAETPAIFSTAF